MIKILIFDLDDTLYKELDFVHEGFKEVARYLNKQWNIDEKKVYDEMVNLLKQKGRGTIFDEICVRHSIDEEVKNLIKIYRETMPYLKLYEDAEEILKWAKERKYKLGIITDGAANVQHNKIKSLRLEKLIDKIVVTYDLGEKYSKPHTASYLRVLEAMDILPTEAIYIGDNPNKDFVGAKELGIYTVRIIRSEGDHMRTKVSQEYEADEIIYDLRDIKKLHILRKG